jgi:hypothetical protein
VRDIGAIVWVLLVIVGVVSSIVSNARKQMANSGVPPRDRPVSGPPLQATRRPATPVRQAPAAPLRPQPAVARQTTVTPERPDVLHGLERAHPGPRLIARLFHDRRSLVRAVVAAEVLGKPLALRDLS